jgi:hypothetical protein
MKIAGYEFAAGAKFQTGATPNAKAVGTHLEKLRKQHKGELTAQQVLEDAKKKTSPIHSFFEWDNSAAAEAYRLSQAQGLITAVVAIYTQDDQPPVQTRASVSVPDRQTGQVHEMSQVATHDAVLRRALRELMAWRKRYEDLSELAPVFSVADLVEKSLLEEEKAAA